MKKIAFLIHTLSISGGVGAVVNRLANAICNQYEIHIIVVQDELVYEGYSFDPQIHIYFMNVKQCALRKQQLLAFPKIINYAKSTGIEVLFAEGTYCGYIAAPTRPFIRGKIVFCDHGSFMSQYNDKKTRFLRRVASSICHYTIVLTERSREDYIRFFHIDPMRIRCIYNWIEESVLNYRRERPYSINSKIILSVGRFSPEKGYDLLVEIAGIVLPKHKEWKWYVFGDGETYDDIMLRVKELHLDKQLIMPGNKKDLKEDYINAAIFVLPSRREGMPLVLLEGKGYKLPLVSFDIVSGPREIITDGVNGILVEAENTDRMADAINSLIDNGELRKKMSDRAYDDIDRFSIQHIMEEWIGFIESIT